MKKHFFYYFLVGIVIFNLQLSTFNCFSAGLPWKQVDFSSGRWVPGGVLYFPLDEFGSSTVNDVSGNGNNGILGTGSNAPQWRAGKYGYGLYFDGSTTSGDYIKVTPVSSSLVQATNGSFSFAAWVNNLAAGDASSPPGSHGIMGRSGYHTYLGFNSSSKLVFAIYNTSNQSYSTSATNTQTLSQWYHVVGVCDNTAKKIYIYVDGVLQGSGATFIGTLKDYSSGSYYVGAIDPTNATYPYWFYGYLDEVSIYNRALSSSEITELYNSGGSQTYYSSDYDCGNTFTLGRISWKIDVPSGCSVALQVSTAGSQGALGSTWSNTVVVTSENSSSDTALNVAPGRWIRYRAIIGKPLGSSANISLKEIKISPAVQGITTTSNGSATPVLKVGDELRFEMDFSVDMDINKGCTVVIVPEGGTPFTISTPSSGWQGSRKFVSGSYPINVNTGSGFADVYVKDAKTSLAIGNQALYHYYSRCFILDTANIVSVGKTAFFPDPFSPNSDGKAEETSLFFNLSTPQEVILRIYTLKGTLVRSLKENETLQGNVEIRWDGKDDSGKLSPIGVYLYSLRTGTQVKNGTVVLSK